MDSRDFGTLPAVARNRPMTSPVRVAFEKPFIFERLAAFYKLASWNMDSPSGVSR